MIQAGNVMRYWFPISMLGLTIAFLAVLLWRVPHPNHTFALALLNRVTGEGDDSDDSDDA
jgi:hypothetical protein